MASTDIVIVSSARTPVGSFGGALSTIAAHDLGAIAEELSPTGRALTLLTATSQERFVAARDVAMDGAFVYSCIPDSEAVRWLIRRGLPLVFVDDDPARGHSSVNIDDRGGARAAARTSSWE